MAATVDDAERSDPNRSTHTTEAMRDFLAAHPRSHLHFTPTSASWLNAAETWVAQLERRVLRRGVFTSVSELREEIRRFIDAHNMTLPNRSDGPSRPAPSSMLSNGRANH